MQRHRSNVDRIKFVFVLTMTGLLAIVIFGGVRSKATTDDVKRRSPVSTERSESVAQPAANPAPQQTPTPAAFQEGCLTCHSQIEPMHKTASGKLDDGKDGQKLSCTSVTAAIQRRRRTRNWRTFSRNTLMPGGATASARPLIPRAPTRSLRRRATSLCALSIRAICVSWSKRAAVVTRPKTTPSRTA